MSWLEQHIDEFVAPILREHDRNGRATTQQMIEGLTLEPLGYFKPEELTVMKNAWRSIKKQAKGETILLPGRDVWLFEVLARREDYPTVFMPECSRGTVRHIAKVLPDLSELFLFDTGFAGSIPKNLKSDKWSLFSTDILCMERQVFPRLTLSRHFALKIEESPKYWESGRMVVGGNISIVDPKLAATLTSAEIKQPMAHIGEFIRAARLTIEVYKNSSPKFIRRHKPLAIERRY